jgi:hypothetical protein
MTSISGRMPWSRHSDGPPAKPRSTRRNEVGKWAGIPYSAPPMASHHDLSNFIWQIAELLRGPYRPSQYERVMLPMTVLRRFDCVLAPSKDMVSKFEPVQPDQHKHGSRLAIVFNGSPLFTGGAGSGESDIRKWIIENDWLEAIIALPEQMFYNGFREIRIPVPPLEEQRTIVSHISAETSKLDALRASTERMIALLKERRAALIAAAVTGKIAVPTIASSCRNGGAHAN